jgi:hypothetical protein
MKSFHSTFLVLGCFLGLNLSACGDLNVRPSDNRAKLLNAQQNSEDSDLIVGSGTIVFSELEGGHFQIWSDDGKTYVPTQLSNELKQDGLRIQFSARALAGSFSYHMSGESISLETVQISQ